MTATEHLQAIEDATEQAQAIADALERGEIDTSQILSTSTIECTLPAGVSVADLMGGDKSALQQLMQESLVTQERLAFFEKANFAFSIFARMSHNSSFDFERKYRDLHDDIEKHKDVWFDKIFNIDSENPFHCERTVGILGTLCTILRQRGDLPGCMRVMPLYMEVLGRYKQQTEGPGRNNQAQIDCYNGLEYKANLIRINCGIQLRDQGMAMKALRSVISYEQNEKARGTYPEGDDSYPDFDFVLSMLIGHNRFDEVTDDILFKALRFTSEERPSAAPQLQPRECGYCGKVEQLRGDFQLCSGCHKESYCSRECQKADWGFHRHLCKKKNTTNIDSDTLKAIIVALVGQYSEAAQCRSGIAVTDAQKQNGKVSLVKKVKKMLVGEFAQYNSGLSVHDANNDCAFHFEIAEALKDLPGFEAVKEIAPSKKEMVRRQKRAQKERRKSGELNLPEDYIRERTDDAVRTILIEFIPRLSADAGRDYFELQSTLTAKIVPITKQYLRKYPQYDSYATIKDLTSRRDFLVEMSKVVAEVMNDAL